MQGNQQPINAAAPWDELDPAYRPAGRFREGIALNEIIHEHTAPDGTSPARLSPFGKLFRLFGSWFGFTGLYAAFSVCPFCGQQACPVGIASAGAVGAFLTLCLQDWKTLFRFLSRKTRLFRTLKPSKQADEKSQDRSEK